jgi:hypothetical protein
MKQWKILPLLIGAVACMPRAHAAEAVVAAEPSMGSLALIALVLVALSAGRARPAAIRVED